MLIISCAPSAFSSSLSKPNMYELTVCNAVASCSVPISCTANFNADLVNPLLLPVRIVSIVFVGSNSVPTSIAASILANHVASSDVKPSARPSPYDDENVCAPIVANSGAVRPPDNTVNARPGAMLASDSTPARTPS